MLQSRKSSLIDERRRCLTQYIKDLLKVEVLRECNLVRGFLEINKYYDDEGRLRVDSNNELELNSNN
jgi:PX domain